MRKIYVKIDGYANTSFYIHDFQKVYLTESNEFGAILNNGLRGIIPRRADVKRMLKLRSKIVKGELRSYTDSIEE